MWKNTGLQPCSVWSACGVRRYWEEVFRVGSLVRALLREARDSRERDGCRAGRVRRATSQVPDIDVFLLRHVVCGARRNDRTATDDG